MLFTITNLVPILKFVRSFTPGQLSAISRGGDSHVVPAQLPDSGSSILGSTLVKATPWARAAAKIRTETNTNSSSATSSRADIQQSVNRHTRGGGRYTQ